MEKMRIARFRVARDRIAIILWAKE